jgi:translation elongation factor EF-4
MSNTFGLDPSHVIRISAKTGEGVEKVLQAIIDHIPAPRFDSKTPLKALLFDSSWGLWLRLADDCRAHILFCFDRYDQYRGVISLVSVQSGTLKIGPPPRQSLDRVLSSSLLTIIGDKVASCHSGKKYDLTDVGIMHPEQVSTGMLLAGQVGYLGMKYPAVLRLYTPF